MATLNRPQQLTYMRGAAGSGYTSSSMAPCRPHANPKPMVARRPPCQVATCSALGISAIRNVPQTQATTSASLRHVSSARTKVVTSASYRAALNTSPAATCATLPGSTKSSALGASPHIKHGLRVRSGYPVRLAATARGRTLAVNTQANLFARISRVVRAYIEGIMNTFEDPERLLDRVVEEMQGDVIRLRQASAQAVAAHRQAQNRHTQLQDAADQWLRRAELAVARNQDELAKEALRRRKLIQGDADRLLQQVKAQQAASEQLQANVRVLENKITEAKMKKETLKARAASAKTSLQIQELIGGLRSTSSSSFAAFEKMEEKVIALEAEAESVAALSAPDRLEARFAELEGSGGAGLDDELKALKAAQGRGPAASLPRPRMSDVLQPQDREVDAELEELRRRARM